MRHIDLVGRQPKALCATPSRLQLPPKHRLYAVRILIQLVVLSIGLLWVCLSPLPSLLVAFRAAVQ